MKKSLSLLLTCAALLCIVSCGSRHNITATIKGAEGNVFVIANDAENRQTDTVKLNNGKFNYDIPETLSDPVFVTVIPESGVYNGLAIGQLFLNAKAIKLVMSHGDRIRIDGDLTSGEMRYTVKGSELNRAMGVHNMEFLPLYGRVDSIEMEIDKAYSLPESEQEEEYIQTLFSERGKYAGEINVKRKNYVRGNPANELSALYVGRFVEPDSLEYYFAMLEPSATDGFLKPFVDAQKKYMAENLAFRKQQEKIVEGAVAPEFSLPDPRGDLLSLADIRSDYIVLDFWGSWCGWCIKGFPKMKEYYAKYKNKVEIVGIDCRDTHEQWIAALEEYQLPWKHVFENVDDKISVQYAVQGYPTKIIIGPDRKIAAIFIGESDEFYQKMDELFK